MCKDIVEECHIDQLEQLAPQEDDGPTAPRDKGGDCHNEDVVPKATEKFWVWKGTAARFLKYLYCR